MSQNSCHSRYLRACFILENIEVMTKRSVILGLSGGAIMVGLFLISYAFGVEQLGYSASEVVGYVSMILGLSTIFVAVRNHRDHDLNGKISFVQAMKAGAIVAVIAALVFGVFTIVLYETTDVSEQLASMYEQDLVEQGMSPEKARGAFEQQMAEVPEWLTTSPGQGFLMFMTVFPLGLIVSAISGLVLKRA